LAQRGISFLAIFTKFGVGEGVPVPHSHANFQHCGFKMWAYTAAKIAKNSNFWYKFAPKKNPRSPPYHGDRGDPYHFAPS